MLTVKIHINISIFVCHESEAVIECAKLWLESSFSWKVCIFTRIHNVRFTSFQLWAQHHLWDGFKEPGRVLTLSCIMAHHRKCFPTSNLAIKISITSQTDSELGSVSITQCIEFIYIKMRRHRNKLNNITQRVLQNISTSVIYSW